MQQHNEAIQYDNAKMQCNNLLFIQSKKLLALLIT